MPLPKEDIEKIRNELDNCKNPLYFFHDDPDGLASFLLLYNYKKEGKGIIVKAVPKLDIKFAKKVDEYQPDKVFILDIDIVEQEFIDNVKVPIIWIDHHEPLQRENVRYFNPRLKNEKNNVPVTYICHKVVQDNLWIAMAGCIGDWYMPDFTDKFKEEFPGMIDIETSNPGEIYFRTKLGNLTRIFSFILKGNTKDANDSFKVMTRIKSPDEILSQTTPQGKFIMKRYEKTKKEYDELLENILKTKHTDNSIVYVYKANKMSFSGDLANELLFRYPDKLVIIGREKSDEIRMSIRIKGKPINKILEKALAGIEGYGGGHEYAVGACVKKRDFERFVENFKNQLSI